MKLPSPNHSLADICRLKISWELLDVFGDHCVSREGDSLHPKKLSKAHLKGAGRDLALPTQPIPWLGLAIALRQTWWEL